METDYNGEISKIFDVYDILGHILSSIVFVLLLIPVTGIEVSKPIKLSINHLYEICTIGENSVAPEWLISAICIFIVFAVLYFIGLIISAISSIVFDVIIIGHFIGYPYKSFLMNRNAVPQEKSNFLNKINKKSFYFLVSNIILLILLLFFHEKGTKLSYIIGSILVVISVIIFFLLGIKKSDFWRPLPKKVKDNFKIKFKNIFKTEIDAVDSEIFWYPFIYIQQNYPAIFSKIKKMQTKYIFARNTATSFLLTLLVYIYTNFNTEMSVSIWWKIFVLVLVNLFLIRYLYLYHEGFSKYLFRAFTVLADTNTKKSK